MSAMDTSPVTHGELRAALTQTEQRLNDRIDQTEQRLGDRIDQLDARFDQFEQRLTTAFDAKLGLWGGALGDRIERIERGHQSLAASVERLSTDMERLTTQQLPLMFAAMEQRMSAELSRHVESFVDHHRSQIAVIDDKYADLPPRVSRLEGAVLTRKR